MIELDGHSHDIDPARDERRDADLRGRGYRVLHFTNDDVREDSEAVALAIRQEIEKLRHAER